MSDVVGSLLLVGITVGMMVGLSLVVLNFTGPVDRLHADLNARLDPGPDRVWGTGDEQVKLTHRGGESVPSKDVKIIIDQNGARSEYAGSGLAEGFADGRMSTGESWSETRTIALVDRVAVLVAIEGGASTVVLSSSLSAPATDPVGCIVDTVAPTVAAWQQSPADVTAATTGSVTVNATLSDACSGVDESTAPHLYYRIEDGSSPAYVDAGPMFKTGAKWSGAIPDLGWLANVGNTLEYHVSPLTDFDGNTGQSIDRQDLIGITGADVFVSSSSVTTGTENNFANAQSDSDGDAAASMTDALVVGGTVYDVLDASSVVSAGGWSSASNAYASDDAKASASGNNPAAGRFGMADAADAGAITSVVAAMEVSGSDTNAGFTLRACLQGTCTSSGVFTPAAPLVDQTFTYDFAASHPLGNATWSWQDVRALQVEVDPGKSGGGANPTYALDHVYVTVGSTGNPYELDAEYLWSGVSPGTNVLQLKYRVLNGETYDLQVWNGAAYATRTTLSGSTWQTYATPLSVGEYNGGAPQVRFLDQGSVQGTLMIEHAKVINS